MYGPALSSWNYFRICGRVGGGGGDSTDESTDGEGSDSDTSGDGPLRELHEEVIEEGGEGDGVKIRRRMAIPSQPAQRKKFFLDEQNRNAFQFEAGRLYKADFGNPYLVFNGKSYFFNNLIFQPPTPGPFAYSTSVSCPFAYRTFSPEV